LGLIENVFGMAQYDSLLAQVFDDFVSMPYDELRIPSFWPARLHPPAARLHRVIPHQARRWIVRRFGGQDYSAFAFRR
jgi:hypothetical protein